MLLPLVILCLFVHSSHAQEVPPTSEQEVKEEVHNANTMNVKKQIIADVTKLAQFYKPGLSELAQEMVNKSELYAAMVDTIQTKFPHFGLGYVFAFEKEEDVKVKSSLVFAFSREKKAHNLATYNFDDLKGFLTSGVLSPAEVAVIRNFGLEWQKKSDEEVQRSIVDHPGLLQLIRDNDLKLSHYIKVSETIEEQESQQ